VIIHQSSANPQTRQIYVTCPTLCHAALSGKVRGGINQKSETFYREIISLVKITMVDKYTANLIKLTSS